MEGTFITLVFSICFVQNSLGLPTLNCDNADPILPSTVKCSCQNVGAPGIRWYREGVVLTSCTLSGGQCFTSMGYTFTVDSTTSTYTIEFGSYNYTECTLINCSDSTAPSKNDYQRISVDVTNYSSTLSVVNEPASSHMNGNIDFTTGCIYKANSSDINVTSAKWTAVVNGTEEGDLDIKGTISKTGSCQFCTDDFASTILVRYIHQEEQSESRIKANIRLRILIDGVPYNKTTRNEYFVKGKNESSNTTTTITNSTSTSDVIKNTTTNSDKNVRSGHTSKPWCCFDIWCIIIFVVVGLAISYIPAVVIRCNKQRFYEVIKGCNLWILIIPFVGLILIIIYCFIFCKGCCRKCKVSGCYRKNTVKPRTPIEFTCDESNVTINSFKVRWKYLSNGGSGLKFLLVWSTRNENEKNEYIPYQNNNNMEYVIRNLSKDTIYNVQICAEINGVRSEFTDNLTVKTLEGMLTQCKTKHQRIAGEDEICCENCKETRGAAHASHALCLSHELYLCLTCIRNEHKNEKCVLLWNTGDIEGKDHKLCCEKKYNYDDLQLKGVCQVECEADNRQTDKLFICSQCIKEKEKKYDNSTSHQQLHGPLNTRVLMCCEKNKTTGGKETVNFCIQCETYVCAPCLNKHNKHLLISSLKSDMDIKPSLYDKTRGVETDFCIQCKRFICASCLEPHPHNNHMVVTSLTGLVSARAGMCCKTGKNDFCIQCQTYLCLSCSIEHHSGHIVLSSLMDDSDGDKTIFCKGCESEKDLPIECLELTKKAFLCSSCYESGNLPKTRENGEAGKSFIKHLNKKGEECQVHAVLGGEPHFVTDVYCLICKLHMCMGCYKKHRRLYEYWSKYLEGNLFYCNHCPTAKKVKLVPVECYDLQSSEFMCGKCYMFKHRNKTSYPDIIKSTMEIYTGPNKQCKLHKDLPPDILLSHTSSTANVFCLVCKEYMCKICFGIHVDRKTKTAKSAGLEKDC